jgi:hypothetical protein
VQCGDQVFGDAAQPEPSSSNRHVVVKQTPKGCLGVRKNFRHVRKNLTTITRLNMDESASKLKLAHAEIVRVL